VCSECVVERVVWSECVVERVVNNKQFHYIVIFSSSNAV
jgi:hypothetical protein